jgi:hypothetical protein
MTLTVFEASWMPLAPGLLTRVVRLVPLVVVFEFFVHWLPVLLAATGIVKCPSEVVAINCCMIGTWMPLAFLLQELLELFLRRCLLASRGMIHSHDVIIWLALLGWTRVVPLALVIAVVIRTPRVAIIMPWEPLSHLFFLLGPVMHDITKPCNSFWSVPPKVSVYAWVGDAIVEAVDDVFLRDIRNGRADIEERACIGP